MGIISWLKNNKLAVFFGLVILFLLFRNSVLSLFSAKTSSMVLPRSDYGAVSPQGLADLSIPSSTNMKTTSEAVPAADVKSRLVIQESNVSLVVDNVRAKLDSILDEVGKRGGYMVSSSLNQPEEAPFATLVIRVPAKDLRSTLDYLRNLSIKVTSENLMGTDVTDQYVDLEARLETLNKTKAKFDEILSKAVTVQDIMQVKQQLIYLQDQIDNLKGQKQYLEKNAENAKLTIYLSTDEWALPYAPSETFRPNVIFKEAVRSMVSTLRGLAKLTIWLGVYSVVWVPVVLVIWFLRRRKKAKLASPVNPPVSPRAK